MERTISISANDGRVFKGTDYTALINEINAYESDLKLKKEKEETARKAKEEYQKQVTQDKAKRLNQVNEVISYLGDLIEKFEKDYGTKLYLTREYPSKDLVVKETKNSIDFAWDSWDQVIKDIEKML